MLKILIESACQNGQISDSDRNIIYQKAKLSGIPQQEVDKMINEVLANSMNKTEDNESGFISVDEEQTTPPPIVQQKPNDSKFTDSKPLNFQGAMSIVSQAKLHGKWIIIKRIKPEYKNNQKYKELFMREFDNAYHLDHPHIVRLLDKGEDSEGLYYTMEYIDGRPLSEMITATGINNDQLSEKIVRQMLDALSYVHKKQIIHRDLKPDNIYITYKGDNVKILDFGLAAADDYEDDMIKVGTPRYASPEQMTKGSTVDQRADIFSFGKIFLEMLTGKVEPDAANQLKNNAYKHIVKKSIAENANDRFNNCDEIEHILNNPNSIPVEKQEVKQVQNKQQEIKPPKTITEQGSAKKKSFLPFIIIGIVVVAAIAVYFLFFNNKGGISVITGGGENKKLEQRADSLFNVGMFAEADQIYENLEKKDDHVNSQIKILQPLLNDFNDAKKIFEGKNIAKAKQKFEAILAEHPNFVDAINKLNECKTIIKNADFNSLKVVQDASSSLFGVADKDMNVVVDYQFDKILDNYFMCKSIGLIPVIKDGKYGFISRSKEILPCQFTSAPTIFADSRYYTMKENGKTFKVTVDNNGSPVIENN